MSEFGAQLREKQKARAIYGVLERQFSKHFVEAERRQGVTGENLLQLLETRLDNVVYRLGFADSRKQARQIVRHGHVMLRGRKTDIPSALVKMGDIVAIYPSSRGTEYFKMVQDTLTRKSVPNWLSLDVAELSGRVLSLPTRDEIDSNVSEQLIVEHYSR
jgi:small subunit ribosomal protein S4